MKIWEFTGGSSESASVDFEHETLIRVMAPAMAPTTAKLVLFETTDPMEVADADATWYGPVKYDSGGAIVLQVSDSEASSVAINPARLPLTGRVKLQARASDDSEVDQPVSSVIGRAREYR